MSYADTTEAQDAALDKRVGTTVSKAGFANLCGVSATTVQAWIQAGMPVKRGGGNGNDYKLDSAQSIVWLIRREREKAKADAPAAPLDSKARIQESNARLKELELARLEGTLIEIELVERVFAKLVGNAKVNLLGLPHRLSPQLANMSDAGQIGEVITQAMYETLEELSKADPIELLDEAEREKEAD